MDQSPVTEYMIAYLKEKGISPAETARILGIDGEKLRPGYKEPLAAEEFLELCVYLGITPEQVARQIRKNRETPEEK